jgi:hypothetical protein
VQDSLLSFIQVLRSHDLRISPAETLDALAAVEILGYASRERLRAALCAALAKTEREQHQVELLFDRFFSESLPEATGSSEDGQRDASEAEKPGLDEVAGGADGELLEAAAADYPAVRDLLDTPLMQALLQGQRGQIATSVRAAARESGLAQIQMFTQKGLYSRKILDALGEEALRDAVVALETDEHPATETLRRYRDLLRGAVRDHVDAQYLLHAEGRNQRFLDEQLADMRLSHIEVHYQDRVRALIAKMARRLASRHSSRRREGRRGRLDMAKTLRRGIASDGVLFHTHWRTRRRDRAQVMALCDVSGSVAAYAKFLLIFLYNLQDMLPRMRSFAFSSHLGEISELFHQHPVERAVELANWQYGGATDYGSSLRDFARLALNDINRETSVIMLGDARNNYGDPGLDIMQSLQERSKQVIWLNPESRRAWGSGDSEMLRYLPACRVAAECGNLQQLERAIEQLLRSTR